MPQDLDLQARAERLLEATDARLAVGVSVSYRKATELCHVMRELLSALAAVVQGWEQLEQEHQETLNRMLLNGTNAMLKAEAEIAALQAERVQLRAALQRMVDWSDCQCEHDDDNCCAKVADLDFHCPGCIAYRALQKDRRDLSG